jgi:hypothetical protein
MSEKLEISLSIQKSKKPNKDFLMIKEIIEK